MDWHEFHVRLKVAVTKILEYLYANCPVDTGLLRNSTKIIRTNNKLEIHIGNEFAYYLAYTQKHHPDWYNKYLLNALRVLNVELKGTLVRMTEDQQKRDKRQNRDDNNKLE